MLFITRSEMILKSRSPFHSLLAGALTLAISGIAAVARTFIFIYSPASTMSQSRLHRIHSLCGVWLLTAFLYKARGINAHDYAALTSVSAGK
jgi:hypothetical protein